MEVLEKIFKDNRFFMVQYWFNEISTIKTGNLPNNAKMDRLDHMFFSLHGFLYALSSFGFITDSEKDKAIEFLTDYTNLHS